MTITITGRHLDITTAARAHIEKEIGRIDRLLHDSAVSAQCAFWRERGAYVFETTVHARADHMLHAVARSARLQTAVSLAAAKVSQQAQKLADKWKTRRRVPAPVRRKAAVKGPRRSARARESEA